VTLRYAGLVSRGAARVVDVTLLAVLLGGTIWLAQQFLAVDPDRCPRVRGWWDVRGHLCPFLPYVFPVAGAFVPPVYRVLFWTLAGRTPGMAFMGLRLVRADGGTVGLGVALRRLLVFFLTVGMGSLLMLFTKRRQGLPDLAAGTVVVYDWGGPLSGPR
jgi:uncharacterized RDD family membrane protein YckC